MTAFGQMGERAARLDEASSNQARLSRSLDESSVESMYIKLYLTIDDTAQQTRRCMGVHTRSPSSHNPSTSTILVNTGRSREVMLLKSGGTTSTSPSPEYGQIPLKTILRIIAREVGEVVPVVPSQTTDSNSKANLPSKDYGIYVLDPYESSANTRRANTILKTPTRSGLSGDSLGPIWTHFGTLSKQLGVWRDGEFEWAQSDTAGYRSQDNLTGEIRRSRENDCESQLVIRLKLKSVSARSVNPFVSPASTQKMQFGGRHPAERLGDSPLSRRVSREPREHTIGHRDSMPRPSSPLSPSRRRKASTPENSPSNQIAEDRAFSPRESVRTKETAKVQKTHQRDSSDISKSTLSRSRTPSSDVDLNIDLREEQARAKALEQAGWRDAPDKRHKVQPSHHRKESRRRASLPNTEDEDSESKETRRKYRASHEPGRSTGPRLVNFQVNIPRGPKRRYVKKKDLNRMSQTSAVVTSQCVPFNGRAEATSDKPTEKSSEVRSTTNGDNGSESQRIPPNDRRQTPEVLDNRATDVGEDIVADTRSPTRTDREAIRLEEEDRGDEGEAATAVRKERELSNGALDHLAIMKIMMALKTAQKPTSTDKVDCPPQGVDGVRSSSRELKGSHTESSRQTSDFSAIDARTIEIRRGSSPLDTITSRSQTTEEGSTHIDRDTLTTTGQPETELDIKDSTDANPRPQSQSLLDRDQAVLSLPTRRPQPKAKKAADGGSSNAYMLDSAWMQSDVSSVEQIAEVGSELQPEIIDDNVEKQGATTAGPLSKNQNYPQQKASASAGVTQISSSRSSESALTAAHGPQIQPCQSAIERSLAKPDTFQMLPTNAGEQQLDVRQKPFMGPPRGAKRKDMESVVPPQTKAMPNAKAQPRARAPPKAKGVEVSANAPNPYFNIEGRGPPIPMHQTMSVQAMSMRAAGHALIHGYPPPQYGYYPPVNYWHNDPRLYGLQETLLPYSDPIPDDISVRSGTNASTKSKRARQRRSESVATEESIGSHGTPLSSDTPASSDSINNWIETASPEALVSHLAATLPSDAPEFQAFAAAFDEYQGTTTDLNCMDLASFDDCQQPDVDFDLSTSFNNPSSVPDLMTGTSNISASSVSISAADRSSTNHGDHFKNLLSDHGFMADNPKTIDADLHTQRQELQQWLAQHRHELEAHLGQTSDNASFELDQSLLAAQASNKDLVFPNMGAALAEESPGDWGIGA